MLLLDQLWMNTSFHPKLVAGLELDQDLIYGYDLYIFGTVANRDLSR
jgi:hypothetical protein